LPPLAYARETTRRKLNFHFSRSLISNSNVAFSLQLSTLKRTALTFGHLFFSVQVCVAVSEWISARAEPPVDFSLVEKPRRTMGYAISRLYTGRDTCDLLRSALDRTDAHPSLSASDCFVTLGPVRTNSSPMFLCVVVRWFLSMKSFDV
jgi:hypothetical protein